MDKKVRGRRKGAVIRILNRDRMQFVGVLKSDKGRCFLEPDDKKMYANILIRETESEDFSCQSETKAMARIIHLEQ